MGYSMLATSHFSTVLEVAMYILFPSLDDAYTAIFARTDWAMQCSRPVINDVTSNLASVSDDC